MIDALLYAVRDTLRAVPFQYDYATCDIMPDGKPPARCGNYFLAIHQGASRSTADNYLDERFSFSLTLTMRVNSGVERVGDQLLARRLARQTARDIGFNGRIEQLRALMHMAWDVLGIANTYLVQWAGDEVSEVYGFCEAFRYRGEAQPSWCYGDWFTGDPSSADLGLKAEMRFDDCRRFQALGTYT